MWNIPEDVTHKILVQFPAEFLLQLRGVCRAWRRVIDDPSFVRAHSMSHTLLVRNKTGAPLYSFSLDSTNGPQIIDATLCKQLIRNRVPLLSNLLVEASCHGLILLSRDSIWAIWNPLTGGWRDIPPPVCSREKYGFGYGFGYDTDAGDYKVVRMQDGESSQGGRVYQTLIYSLKLNSCRKIADCPCRVLHRTASASLDRKLYWLSEDGYKMVELDLGTETHCPNQLKELDHNSLEYVILDALDGCLILTDYFDLSRPMYFVGWVMKDEGLNKSWIQLFEFNRFKLGHDLRGKILRIVAYLKSKRQVILQHELGFVCIDVTHNFFKKFSIHGFPRITSSKICPGSLVRLNIGGGNAVGATSTRKRKRNTKRRDARLKLCIRDVGERCCSDNLKCGTQECRRLCELHDDMREVQDTY